MKRILAAAILFLMLPCTAMAGTNEVPADWTEATPEAMAEAGLDLLLQGKYAAMIDKLFESSDRNAFDESKLDLFKRQSLAQLPMYEKILRYELAEKKTFGESTVRLIYIVISEKCPLIFTFHFFRPKDDWTIYSFNFSDSKEALP
jgi:hypothetical protein